MIVAARVGPTRLSIHGSVLDTAHEHPPYGSDSFQYLDNSLPFYSCPLYFVQNLKRVME